MLSAGAGCEIAVATRVKTALKKVRELPLVLTSRNLSYKTRGHVYSSCVRSVMLHANETWQLLFVCFVALRPKSTAMVIAGRSVHLTTLFSWASLNKQLTSNRAHTFACN